MATERMNPIVQKYQAEIRAIQQNDDLEYPLAIQKYAALKQSFLSDISAQQQNLLAKDIEAALTGKNSVVEKVESQALSDLSEPSEKFLQSILDSITLTTSGRNGIGALKANQRSINDVLNDMGAINNKVGSLTSTDKTALTEYSKEIRLILKNNFDEVQKIFHNFDFEKTFQEAFGDINTNNADLESLKMYYKRYYLSAISWKIQQKMTYVSKGDLIRLAGYAKEAIEKNALQDYFKDAVTVELIAGKNTIEDIVFHVPAAVSGTVLLDNPTMNEYAEQIKLFNYRTKGAMNLSHHSNLLTKLNSVEPDLNADAKYSKMLGMWYLGSSYARIAEALGPRNILFSLGKDRMFTDDFIRQFRSDRYYLGFQIRNQMLTSQVALMRPKPMKLV